MNILFLDQSGKLGGAELSLIDVASAFGDRCLVGLFDDGPFRQTLEQHKIPVKVLDNPSFSVYKDSTFWQSLKSLGHIAPLVSQIIRLSRDYDVIYANTQKAFVLGAIASLFTHRPLVYHLRDILSSEHFSRFNLRLAVCFANQFASLVIANSHATQKAFMKAGGRAELVSVVYNGFEPASYSTATATTSKLRKQLNLDDRFVVGHFSRLSPWKGQHVLLEALSHCPDNVTVLFVGDALFGECEYVEQLHRQVAQSKLGDRVRFLGFRSDIPQLMTLCNLVAHTSIAPEPFGRVIIEAMLCGTPIVAAAAGGVIELIEPGKTGWLTPPGDALKLAAMINQCCSDPEQARAIAQQATLKATQRFQLSQTNQQIAALLNTIGKPCRSGFEPTYPQMRKQ